MALDFSGFQYIGGGVGDLFSAGGSFASAKDLNQAATLEDTNAKLAAASTDIQEQAARRDISKVVGGQQADVAAAGFQMSGSGLDLARDTARQGAITEALIADQGQIDVQGHTIQAAGLRSQASNQQRQGGASIFSGLLNIGMGVLGLFSDERMKENIKFIRVGKNGRRMYEYNYKADPATKWVGYMAQEVEKAEPDMVIDLGLKLIDSEYAPEKVNG